jgi:hypothetical protein
MTNYLSSIMNVAKGNAAAATVVLVVVRLARSLFIARWTERIYR